MKASLFSSVTAGGAHQVGDLDLLELHSYRYQGKHEQPLIGLFTLGSKTTGWSMRNAENLETITGVVLDHDAGTMSYDDALSAVTIERLRCLIRESSTPGRWHLLVPFSEPVAPRDGAQARALLEVIVGKVQGLLNAVVASTESVSPSQIFYIGDVTGSQRCEEVDGDFIDMIKVSHPIPGTTPKLDREGKVFVWSEGDDPRTFITRGVDYHHGTLEMSYRLFRDGLSEEEVFEAINAAFDEVPEDQRDTRWVDRHDDVARTINYKKKFALPSCTAADFDAFDAGEPSVLDKVLERIRTGPVEEIKRAWAAKMASMPPDTHDAIVRAAAKRLEMTLTAARAAGKMATAARRVDEQAKARAATAKGRRSIVIDPTNLQALADTLEELAVASNPVEELLTFGGMLVRVTLREPAGMVHCDAALEPPKIPSFEMHTPTSIIGACERGTSLSKVVMRSEGATLEPAEMPPRVMKLIVDNTSHAAPVVRGLVSHPTVVDRRLVSDPGLDDRSGLFLSHEMKINPRVLTQEQAAQAMARVKDVLLSGFEFESPLDSDMAVYAMMTGVMRKAIDIAPGVSAEAAVQQSGKTTLIRRIHIVLTGRDLPVSPMSEDEEEMRKALLTYLMGSPAVICFDNVKDGGTIKSPTLAAVLTTTEHVDRILGSTRYAKAPTNTLICFTGNNLVYGSDEASRILQIRLTSSMKNPAERQYRDVDVFSSALASRAAVLEDLLSIGMSYDGSCKVPSSRYPAWDEAVRRPLIWAGAMDSSQRTAELVDDATADSGREGLVKALYGHFGNKKFKAADAVEGTRAGFEVEEAGPPLLQALQDLIGAKGTITPRLVSKMLKRFRGAPVEIDGVAMALHVDRGDGKHRTDVFWIKKH